MTERTIAFGLALVTFLAALVVSKAAVQAIAHTHPSSPWSHAAMNLVHGS